MIKKLFAFYRDFYSDKAEVRPLLEWTKRGPRRINRDARVFRRDDDTGPRVFDGPHQRRARGIRPDEEEPSKVARLSKAPREPAPPGLDLERSDVFVAMAKRFPLLMPAGAAAVLLVGALGPWSYGYFVLLRWIVCFAALMVAFRAHEIERPWALWTFGLVALLFNPLVPVYLTRELWAPIDIVTAVLFGVAIISLRERGK